jgi:hypothetical protein
MRTCMSHESVLQTQGAHGQDRHEGTQQRHDTASAADAPLSKKVKWLKIGEGRRGTAAQHTHYGAGHRDVWKSRVMHASSGPPGACSARSRAPPARSLSESLPDSLPMLGLSRDVGIFYLSGRCQGNPPTLPNTPWPPVFDSNTAKRAKAQRHG